MSKALATKNVAAVLLGVALVVTFAFAFATPAKADTLTDLQAQVQALLAQIASLQGGSSSSGSSMSGAGCHTFTQNLKQGATGGEVMWMQQFLNGHGFQVSASGAGSPGNETSYFGAATKAAVIKFQNANAATILTPVGLTAGTGNWFAATRAAANAMCAGGSTGGSTGGTTGGVGGSLMVSAGTQPANSLAPKGASRVPFTTFTLTNSSAAPVTVTGVNVQRTGLANDAAFSGVVLVDAAGLQVGISRSLNSNHMAIVGDNMTINPGQSVTLTVAANIAADLTSYTGQVGSFAVTGVNVSSGSVAGSLPITGAMQTLNNSLVVGTVQPTVSAFDPNSAQTKNIGDTNIKFTGVRFTAGSAEDLKLYSIRFRQAGSISSSDLGNVMVNVNGTEYPVTWSSDGKYVTVVFAGGILIQKGNAVDAYIHGDLIGGNIQGRTAEFDIDKLSDVYFVGQTYGYGVMPTLSGSCNTLLTGSHATCYSSLSSNLQPWFQGSSFTLNGSSVTNINKANEVAAQNVALNVPNQVLGGYVVDLKGEDVQVQNQTFYFTFSAIPSGSGLLTNVSIVDENGAVVAGPVDATSSVIVQGVNFSDTVTYKTGRHVFTVKGKLPSATNLNNATVQASTNPASWSNITGVTSGNTVSFSSMSLFSMNTMTVRAATLAISVSATPAAQSVVAGAQNVLLANVQFDASQSGEDVRFSSFPVTLTMTGGFTEVMLTSCQAWDGTTALNTGSNIVNPVLSAGVATFTLDSSVVVTKGTIKTIGISCNTSPSAAGTVAVGMTGAQKIAVSATGVTSSNTVTPTGSTQAGQIMTIGTGSLTVTLDSSSPAYSVVPANTTGVVLGAYKFHATNEAVNLNRIGLKLTNTASSSAADLTQVTLWSGSTQIGTATFVGAETNATSSLSSPLTLTKDADTVVVVKGDIAPIGVGQPGTSGHLIAVNVDTNGATNNGNTRGTGNSSGVTVNASGSTAVQGVRIFKSVPIFTYPTAGGALISGTNDLLVLTVTADAKGPVKLNKLTFALSTTTATLTAPTFSGPNGNVSASANSTINALGTSITVTFDSTSNTQDAEIAAGQSKVYTLRGSVVLTGNSGQNGSVSVALKSDTSFPAFATTFMGATAALSGSNIIWSPESTTTPTTASDDWANAYGLGGCYTTAGLGNDCTTRTVSK